MILSIQAGRSLLKIVGNKMGGNVPEGALQSSVRHLYAFDPKAIQEAPDATQEHLGCPHWLVNAFEKRSEFVMSLERHAPFAAFALLLLTPLLCFYWRY